ncbi:MAG: hypothetical protein OEY10_01705 [Nitrosopumilus sp.]|nr:hypothetical protein [Nitrosopumilus sp.]MDH3489588.1 hypothetical protein [Nitrosopumilus sp.]MDH3516586.1 hypothetical protein [Nitrosopumilus sp.]MDH3565053.1 hypothetical protein [Nitrosopumilus sp.]MDH5416476.1 hypothetical protein [Nitrosopumilus sp.]
MAGYLGNKSKMIVHHLAVTKVECDIYEVKKDSKQYFIPDMLDQAKKEGFTPCKHCIQS